MADAGHVGGGPAGPLDVHKLAAELRTAIHMSRKSLLGAVPPGSARILDRMHDVRPGDLVAEWTARGFSRDIDSVGYLVRVTDEDMYPDWDEAREGQPCPTERVHCIRTLDGREVRWRNCEFVAAITDDGPFGW